MLQKTYRMLKKQSFQSVFAHGKSYASKHMVIYIFKGSSQKFGFIASKKVGNAVQRNLAKRLMREAVRLNMPHLTSDYHMVLIARTAINKIHFKEVEKSLLYLWRRAGIYNETDK